MTRLTLRKGFTLQAAPGGVGHITDLRTGDALVVPSEDYSVLAAAGDEGLDSSLPEVAGLLAHYGPFFVAAKVEGDAFYELNIEDAPTVTEIPSVAPVTVAEIASIEPVTVPEFPAGPPMAFDRATTLNNVPAVEAPPAAAPQEQEQEHDPFAALETAPTQQVSPSEVKAMLESPAAQLVAPGTTGIATVDVAGRSSRRPMVLTLIGVTLLGLGVAATFALRPAGEPPQPEAAALDAGAALEPVDAGVAVVAVVPGELDAGSPEPELDAGTTEPLLLAELDAGAAVEEPDAGSEEDGSWLTAEVQARGRVKMGEVLAPADGELDWTVTDQQRVKARQVLGTLNQKSLVTPSVGLAILKQPTGSSVKRGAVVAEIIYFEAWARGLVKGAVPKPSWRCEVTSAATQQRADCKISVVTPKSGGALVTVAIEPRWFDGATDAVLRLAP